MANRVFVTGGSGFVGSEIIDELRARGWSVNALVRRHDLSGYDSEVHSVKGSLFDATTLDAGLADCEAIIQLVGIIKEDRARNITFDRIHYQGTKNLVDAARRVSVKRFLHMSALGVRADAQSEYHRSKFKAEEYLRASGLDWTIIQPSLIHGPGGEFMQMEAKWARKQSPPFFAMPYFGAGCLGLSGAGLLQPVYVKDVARAFVDAMENSRTIQQTYPLGGPDRLTWPELHQAVAMAVVGHRRWVLPFPVPIAKFYAAIGFGKLLGFNRDQIIMSQEDNTCDLTKFKTDFGWDPQPFVPTLHRYAKQL